MTYRIYEERVENRDLSSKLQSISRIAKNLNSFFRGNLVYITPNKVNVTFSPTPVNLAYISKITWQSMSRSIYEKSRKCRGLSSSSRFHKLPNNSIASLQLHWSRLHKNVCIWLHFQLQSI